MSNPVPDPNAARTNGRKILTMSDLIALAASSPGIPWLVENVFIEGSLHLVHGPAGGGKSFFAAYLAYCVASGKAWFGRATQKRRVLWFDAENGAMRSSRRFVAVGCDNESDLLYQETNNLRFDKPADVEEIAAIINEREGQVVIFDSLVRFHEADENSNSAMSTVLAGVRKVQEQTRATVILIHHEGKGNVNRRSSQDNARGASDIIAAIDQGYSLSHDRRQGMYRFQATKNRDIEDKHLIDLAYRMVPMDTDKNHLEFIQVDDDTKSCMDSENRARKLVLTALAKGELNMNALARETGVNKQTLKVVTESLIHDKTLKVRTKGTQHLYSLPPADTNNGTEMDQFED